jgi:hypothetical protein
MVKGLPLDGEGIRRKGGKRPDEGSVALVERPEAAGGEVGGFHAKGAGHSNERYGAFE